MRGVHSMYACVLIDARNSCVKIGSQRKFQSVTLHAFQLKQKGQAHPEFSSQKRTTLQSIKDG